MINDATQVGVVRHHPACPLAAAPASGPRNQATHSALPQVRPEPRRGLPHRQIGCWRASHAACVSNSAAPPSPGTETTGRIRPPGKASHSCGLTAAALAGMGPIAPSSPAAGPHRIGRAAPVRAAPGRAAPVLAAPVLAAPFLAAPVMAVRNLRGRPGRGLRDRDRRSGAGAHLAPTGRASRADGHGRRSG
jgi:hypothetical protein